MIDRITERPFCQTRVMGNSKKTTVNELESKERIMFNSPNVADTYENALLKNIFYADYSIWADADEDYTWATDMELTSPAVDDSEIVYRDWETDRKSTRLNSSHSAKSRMPSSA